MKINIFLLGILLAIQPMAAQNTRTETIDFESWPDRTALSNQPELLTKGIRFTPEIEVVDISSWWWNPKAASGNKVGGGFISFELNRNPMEAIFPEPVLKVSLKVAGLCIPNQTCNYKGALVAYDINGNEIDRDESVIGTDWSELLVLSSEGIAKIRLEDEEIGTSNIDPYLDIYFDDLTFEFLPEDLNPPSIALLYPNEEYTIVPAGQLDLGMEVIEEASLERVYYEIVSEGGSKVRIDICGAGNSCIGDPLEFSDLREVNLIDLGFLPNGGACTYKVSAVAIDGGGNISKDSRDVTIGWSSDRYDPEAYNIKKIKGCSDEEAFEIELAYDLLVANVEEIVESLTFYRKKGEEMSERRQDRLKDKYVKRIKRLRKVVCDSKLCEKNENAHGRSGGLLTKRVILCYDNMRDSGKDFCGVFNTFAHELAHMANIPWNRGQDTHTSSNERDNVYLIGNSAEDWCRNNCHNHPIN